ncbi:PA14 domain-containing protein [Neobacillus niacini]|uniref:PA14 domain-containing protein n=1 Tax=Neobacillus niacini TaxID=86668 RepID=UPI0021CB29AD|nr:PA14 domain-containing protein [Neobacillus niacini]MCM3763512.1 PA14 domain-containing protein [Neobacillus niacini]
MNHNLIKCLGAGVLTFNLTIGMPTNSKAEEAVFKPPASKIVHYNWGTGSPGKGIPADRFTAIFDQSGNYAGGDYFIQTLADDGVKVEVDGQWPIDRWSNSAGNIDRALWLGVKDGAHTVKTHYYEEAGEAAVFSDVVPFDSWLAYYYPNTSLSGLPTAAKVLEPVGELKKLYEDNGLSGPVPGFQVDQFSARYVTAKHIPAGEYILRAKADDGVRVYVDGKLVLDRWSPAAFQEDATKIQIADRKDAKPGEEDVHWIQVEYYEGGHISKLEFFLEPFQKAIDNTWVAEFYPNMTLSGNPVVVGGNNSLNKLPNISFDWKSSSPHTSLPADRFSARLTKRVDLEEGLYQFEARADDGVRVLVDNKVVIDSWREAGGDLRTGKAQLEKGTHTITVEYYENTGLASLSFDYHRFTTIPTKVGKTVHYNWGNGSPGSGLPADRFLALFDQSGTYSSGDYFIQTLADDGVKVEVDGKWLINRWSNSSGDIDRALWLGVKDGEHTVKTHYYEETGGAAIFSDVVPFDSWLAYYYPNTSLSGVPTAAKVLEPVGELKKLYQDNGLNGPVPGFKADEFSARYVTAKHIPAGEYILRARADDGVRVYVDGKLVLDRWSPAAFQEDATKIQVEDRKDAKPGEEDVHWIQVEYYEGGHISKLEFFLEPFQKAFDNTWVAEYYPNMTLSGNPVIVGGNLSANKLSNISFDWKSSSPHPSLPVDRFSARFTKKVELEAGMYHFETRADDGVRVLVDNKVVIDSWREAGGDLRTGKATLEKGSHTITVEYYENTGLASLSFNYQPFISIPTIAGKAVHYNWGNGSPGSGLPSDRFTAVFDQSGTYSSGDYFVQTLADDGVKVEVDGQWLINRWSNSSGDIDRALWLGVKEGKHTVKTHYYEDTGGAAVYSDVVPFDSWLAYYYPNTTLSGVPTAAKVLEPVGELKKLSEDNGLGGPVPGFQPDQFSARYVTAKHIPAGEYILRAKADDGVRVYVDGKLVLDRWGPGTFQEDATKIQIADRTDTKPGQENVHWIQVEYYEGGHISNLEFFLEPFEKVIDNTWVGEFYSNMTLSGNPIVIGGANSAANISKIDFNWGSGSPDKSIPSDRFSGKFTKKVQLEAGTYLFKVKSDDGVKVFVDNELILDNWQNKDVKEMKKVAKYLSSGQHTLVIEYMENTGDAFLSFDYQKISSVQAFYSSANQINYNWGAAGPVGFLTDKFEAYFDQSQYLNSGDYFIQTLADDGVKVEVDGNTVIDRWSDSSGALDQALLLNLPSGNHEVITRYYENTGEAFINSNILPLDSWVAYYYPNTTLTGTPAGAKVISPVGQYKALSESNGEGSPIPGIVPSDNFSAKYRTAKRLPAGDYLLRAKADDGIKVFVDGNLVFDRWTLGDYQEDAIKISIQDRNVSNPDEKNIHWIEVQYYDSYHNSALEVFLQPLNEAMNTDQWIGYLYPNKTFSGNPLILGGNGAQTPIQNINYYWGNNQPHRLIPADGFTARFVKKAYFNTGVYQIKTRSDDGIRVKVDGQVKIDAWVDGLNDKETRVTLGAGYHEIEVEYYENTGAAELKVDILNLTANNAKLVSSFNLPVYRSFDELADYTKHLTFYNSSYVRYFELGYGDLVYLLEENRYAAKIVTPDGREGWVHKDYLENNLMDDFWLVKDGRTLRSQASNSSANIGFVAAKAKVRVLERVTTPGSAYSDWYYIETEAGQRGWIWGAITTAEGNKGYNLIKYEFDKVGTVTNQVTIFTPLNTKANVTADQINRFIDYKTQGKKSVMTGMGYAYLIAQEQSGLNAVYLLAHSGLETGWGTSTIVQSKYNFYGIGAIDSKPAEGAYDYTTPEGGIIAGASWIRKNYVIRDGDTDTVLPFYQPTIDNMRFDNSWHQYASDEAWASKIGYFAQEFYNFINK